MGMSHEEAQEQLWDRVPAELRTRPQWVCWRREVRKDKRGQEKYTKTPYNPRTGRKAESDNPQTWASFEEARHVYERSQQGSNPYDGLGYMFHGDVTGVDLDHCVSETGTIDAWAQAYVRALNSYGERSPSDGVHILLHGQLPKGIRRGIRKLGAHPRAAIEIYSQGRYFTITGKHLTGTPTTIEARQEALEALYQELTQEKEAGVVSQATDIQRPGQGKHDHRSLIMLDDDALLQRAVQASNGAKFRALFYDGNISGYPSASEADMALCIMLAFWTGKDLERMDRLFRRSALYREKWDSARSESTYGWDTLHLAAARCRVVYDPQHSIHHLDRDIQRVTAQTSTERRPGKRERKNGAGYQITPKEVSSDNVLRYLDMNEYGDALFFAEAFAGQVCFDHTDSTWYLWNGHHWRKDLTGKVRQMVAGVLGSLYLRTAATLNVIHGEVNWKLQQLQGQPADTRDAAELAALQERYKVIAGQIDALQRRARDLRSARRNANVLKFIESEMGVTSDMWDTDPWLLPVPNGVLDLRTSACRDGKPEEYIRTVAPTEWTGLETPCLRFEQFLQEIFEDKPDSAELIAFLQRLLGYCITGLVTEHVFPIFYGPEGRNGKDTLLGVLKGVLGPLVGAVSNDVFIAQDKHLHAGGAATPHLSALQGKRLAWGSETRQGDRLNVAQVKQLTGGGDISTRPPYGKDFYTFSPTHKLLLMTNYKPHAEARDKAFWSRACLIQFDLRFVEDPKEPHERKSDPHLKEILQQEASGILAWLVRGCLDWQRQGLAIPASVQLATDKYRDEEDRLLLFIQECCVVKSEAYVKAGALYTAYKKWCEENQMGRAMNGKDFGQEINKRFPRKTTKIGRVYQGIGLLAPDTETHQQTTLFSDEEISGEGGEGSPLSSQTNQDALEADSRKQRVKGVKGVLPKIINNNQSSLSIEGFLGNSLHTLHPSPTVTIDKSALEANASMQKDEGGDPSHPSPHQEDWEDETI
jgi:putative DNA primase/helicase